MTTINVSIIIPVFNAEVYLNRCFCGIINQTMKNIEYIFIDDGSTDQSPKYLDCFASLHTDCVIVIHQKNEGPSAARNRGIKLARGTYIGFLDADDVPAPELYEKMFRFAASEQSDLIITGRYDVSESNPDDPIAKIPNSLYSGFSIMEQPFLLSTTTQFVWDKLFLRETMVRNQIEFDSRFRYTEDVLFLCRLKYYCKKISILPEPLYYHYQNDKNPIQKYGSSILDTPKVMREIISFYIEQNQFVYFRQALFDLTAKRFLYRIERFPYIGNHALQGMFCKQMYDVFRAYFPDWKKRLYHYRTTGCPSLPLSFVLIHPFLMKSYILIPNRWKLILIKYQKKLGKTFSKKPWRAYTIFFKTGFYAFCLRALPLTKSSILLESKSGKDLGSNINCLLSKFVSDGRNVSLVVCKSTKSELVQRMKNMKLPTNQVHFIIHQSYRYYYRLAISRYLFNDSAFPVQFIKRAGQTYVNTWHGTPFKAMGRDIPARAYAIGNVQRNFLLSDYLIAPSKYFAKKMMSAYMIEKLTPEIIQYTGYPRNYVFFQRHRRDSLRKSLRLENKSVFCYLPTWRGSMTAKKNHLQHVSCIRFLQQLDHLMNESQILYVKLHLYASKGFEMPLYRHIFPYPANIDTYEFLSICDCLITDYSSVMFDFAVSRRKIILFAYDKEDYYSERGHYISLEDLPFPHVFTVDELYNEMNREKSYDDTGFITKFCKYESSNASEQLIELVMSRNQPPLTNKSISSQVSVMVYLGDISGMSEEQLTRILKQYTDLVLQIYQNQSIPTLYFGILTTYLKGFPQLLACFYPDYLYIALPDHTFYTPLEAVSAFFILKKKMHFRLFDHYIKRLFQRERRRAFGDVVFSRILLTEFTDDKHRFFFADASSVSLSAILPNQ